MNEPKNKLSNTTEQPASSTAESQTDEEAHDKIISQIRKNYGQEKANGTLAKVSVLFWLVVAIGMIFLVLSKLDFMNVPSLLESKWLTNGKDNINLTLTEGQNLIVLIKRGNLSEVRLLDSNTGRAQDISLGDRNVRIAASSPTGDVIAYVSTDDAFSKLFLCDLKKNDSSSTVLKPLDLVFTSKDYKVCEWSGLYWSPKSDKLAFFGCDEKGSKLYVVPAQKNGVPRPLDNTAVTTKQTRQAIWLKNGNMVFTSGIEEINCLELLVAPDPGNNQIPQRLYGSPK